MHGMIVQLASVTILLTFKHWLLVLDRIEDLALTRLLVPERSTRHVLLLAMLLCPF